MKREFKLMTARDAALMAGIATVLVVTNMVLAWMDRCEAVEVVPPVATEQVREVVPAEVVEVVPVEVVDTYPVPLDGEFQIFVIEQAEENGIDPAIIFAMIERESSYRAGVVGDNGNSFGLMQIQPRWHSERMGRLGCHNLLDPYQNVTVGVDFLAELLDRYDGDMGKALTAYNRGHYAGTVSAYAMGVMENSETLKEGMAEYVLLQ